VRNGLARGLLALLLWPALALAQAQPQEQADTLPSGTPAPEIQPTASVPVTPADNVPWYQHIQDAAKAHGVDPHLLQAVVKVESNFDTYVVSRAGAVGLMQIMPATAVGFIGLRGTRQSLRQQLQDPAINVHAGALYLRSLMDTFSQRLDLALAAYNAGSGNVRKAGNRVPPNGETPRFVKKVSELYASIKAAALTADAAVPAPTEATTSIPAQPVFAPQ
jgi:soluble lytic murein transglycosylase-like protein